MTENLDQLRAEYDAAVFRRELTKTFGRGDFGASKYVADCAFATLISAVRRYVQPEGEKSPSQIVRAQRARYCTDVADEKRFAALLACADAYDELQKLKSRPENEISSSVDKTP